MFKVTVTTVERTAVEAEDVAEVVVQAVDQVLTILPHHVQLVSVLGTGELQIRFQDEEKEPLIMFIDGGILQVDEEGEDTLLEILTDLAERADELDTAKIEEAKRRAEKLLEEKPVHIDLAKIEASLQKELARLKLAKKYKPQ